MEWRDEEKWRRQHALTRRTNVAHAVEESSRRIVTMLLTRSRAHCQRSIRAAPHDSSMPLILAAVKK
jgi:hypothetical protein